ncbi:hypothetical protein K503DRAFT_870022 [Rhizopogon vinicolor AM-OR11-026]|uniref:Uncharacterized protein n=1 Tax=Rhizopogon vinicolor AM-OR11-026 TaxID=1314800 RepID=A0A1B7MJ93_9AGAM|nr:hypothetical protein K503DRAFT_870022 [Rhizopogon vinicolor AM-OR11-026]
MMAKASRSSQSSLTKHIIPISSLPDKLLLIIFQALVDDMYCADDELRLDCFTFTGVCHRWRSLVLGIPQFWTRLYMVIRPRALSAPRLETYVKRSANALVDVIIYLPCPPNSRVICPINGPPNFPRTEACLKILQDCSHRWRSLRIIKQESDYTDIFNLVLSKLSLSRASALHEVQIICPSNGWVTFVEETFQLLSSTYTPSLRKLILQGCDSKILPRHFDASSLTHLSLNFIMEYDDIRNSHVAFRSLLLSARNLMFLEVHPRVFRVEHVETSGELDPVILPVLRTLNVFMDTEKPAYLNGILGTITAPNLLHFAVYNQIPKFPFVRKLTMKNVLQSMYGPGKNIRSIFTAFPHVTDAVLDQDIREVADYIAVQSYDQNTSPPWPCLMIEMPPMTKFHYLQQLLEWLCLRRASRLPLPAVVIRYGLQGPGANDARDLTMIRRVVNDTTGYRASDTREVAKQLGKLGALVDLRVTTA